MANGETTVLTPGQLLAYIAVAQRELDLIREEYGWVHSAAYGLGGRSDGGGGRPGTSKPTETTAISVLAEEGQRATSADKCRQASDRVINIVSQLTQVLKNLRISYTSGDATGLIDMPETASKAERRRAERAKQRRENRGEGWGDG
jgi:hypothetical protein